MVRSGTYGLWSENTSAPSAAPECALSPVVLTKACSREHVLRHGVECRLGSVHFFISRYWGRRGWGQLFSMFPLTASELYTPLLLKGTYTHALGTHV